MIPRRHRMEEAIRDIQMDKQINIVMAIGLVAVSSLYVYDSYQSEKRYNELLDLTVASASLNAKFIRKDMGDLLKKYEKLGH